MSLLVTGAGGQLGWALCRLAAARGYDPVGLTRTDLDVSDKAAVTSALQKAGVGLVVNAAAYTAVDRAESEPALAMRVNRDGPAVLAAACADRAIPLVHFSTDYVFDGRKSGAYVEDDPIGPQSVYGRSKAKGEAAVRDRLAEHVILRTSWLYGLDGRNFVKAMLDLGRGREELGVVADQRGCPTFAADLADAVLVVAGRLRRREPVAWGTYHCCGRGETTWHGLAEKIFELARGRWELKVRRVKPVTTAEFGAAAPRPANSVMDASRFTAAFGHLMPKWEDGLRRMLDALADRERSM